MVQLKLIVPLLGLIPFALTLPAGPDIIATSSSRDTLVGCLVESNVPTISPSDAQYAPAVSPYNLRVPFFPAAVAVPTTSEHVSSAIKCAQRFQTKVAARSGGHSYAAFGLGGENGSLMIDMKKFRALSVDPNTYIATIGAGLRLGDIASGIYNIASRGLPHGTCPGVGISGHALHGGFGFLSRMWGTTLDNIVEMEVVLASGDIVTVSKELKPDLFWALRGAGSSFAVVTTFKIQTYPAPNTAVSFSWSWNLDNAASETVEKKVKIFEAMQKFSVTAPENLAIALFTMPMYGSFVVNGVYWGSRADYNTVIAPLAATFPQDGIPTPEVRDYGYIDMLVALGGGGPLPQPEDYTAHNTFFTKSISTSKNLTTEALTSFFTFHGENADKPPLSWWVLADLYGGQHSKILAQNPDDSSYSIRDSFFTFQLYSDLGGSTTASYPPWGIELMDGLSRSLTEAQSETEFQAYVNYVDPSLSPAEAHKLYYGKNYPRLKELKTQYDPALLLWNPQAIGTS